MVDNSTLRRRSRKPKRKPVSGRPLPPYKNFPLYAHPGGRWACKGPTGRFYYFEKWGKNVGGEMVRLPDDDSENGPALQSLKKYEANRSDILTGQDLCTSAANGVLTLKDLCNEFLTSKLNRVSTGEMSPRTLVDYKEVCDRLITAFGKPQIVANLKPLDFARLRDSMAKHLGPVRLGNEITRIKTVFRFAFDNELIADPIRFGTQFAKPSKKVLRLSKAEGGKKLFTIAELQRILAAVNHDPQMRLAVLLGLSCGLGNSDVARLERKHLNLSAGWLNFPRVKTGIDRRVPLWPEVAALSAHVIAVRPKTRDEGKVSLVFLNREGQQLVRVTNESRTDYISRRFKAVLAKLKINGRRGLGFYSLRHSFASMALQAKDRDAVKALMGHAENDMLATYDETGPSDDRRRAVCEHVRRELFYGPWPIGGDR